MEKIKDKNLFKVIEVLKQRKEILSVILFGSYARKYDYSSKHSDIDLYLIVDRKFDKLRSKFDYESLLYELIDKYMKDLNIEFVIDTKTYLEDGKLLRYNVMKDGILLYSRNNINYLTLKKDLGIEEYFLIEMNLKNLTTTQRFSFKRTLKKHSDVLYVYGQTIIFKKIFLDKFKFLCDKFDVRFNIVKDFITNNNGDF